MSKIDLSNKIFGRLLVLEEAEKIYPKRTRWKCLCDCGKIAFVNSRELRNGDTRSCGCFRSEYLINRNKSKATHNMSQNRIYKIWNGIKDRCLNPNLKDYKSYGARGITICDSWKNSFENFYKDMGDPPTNKHQIDRIDNDGNYDPSNCRWVTQEQNACNTGKHRDGKNNYKGVTKCKNGKFIAQITKDKVHYYLGIYSTEKEAALAYNKKAFELNGEYAYLNKIL